MLLPEVLYENNKLLGVRIVEIKDLFEFMHKTGGKEVSKNINTLLKAADEDDQQIILKIIRAIVQ